MKAFIRSQLLPCLLMVLLSSVPVRPQGEDKFFDPNPQYKFSYKVAGDKTQTYINQEESRDGDYVNGEYSYVDPIGSLVTVVYGAGPEGFKQTTTVQKGFVSISPENIAAGSKISNTKALPNSKKASRPGFNEDKIVQKIVGGLAPVIKDSVAIGLDSN